MFLFFNLLSKRHTVRENSIPPMGAFLYANIRKKYIIASALAALWLIFLPSYIYAWTAVLNISVHTYRHAYKYFVGGSGGGRRAPSAMQKTLNISSVWCKIGLLQSLSACYQSVHVVTQCRRWIRRTLSVV